MDKIYTIKNLCDELNQPIQKIRRRLNKLDIIAINEYTRTYKNEPLKYNYQDFLKLAEEFNISVKNEECTASVQQCTTECTTNVQHNTEDNSKDKLIKILEKQLDEANKSRANLEKLLDQQQQLMMISNQKIEQLKLEVKENKTKKEEFSENNEEIEKKKWWEFFKIKK